MIVGVVRNRIDNIHVGSVVRCYNIGIGGRPRAITSQEFCLITGEWRWNQTRRIIRRCGRTTHILHGQCKGCGCSGLGNIDCPRGIPHCNIGYKIIINVLFAGCGRISIHKTRCNKHRQKDEKLYVFFSSLSQINQTLQNDPGKTQNL